MKTSHMKAVLLELEVYVEFDYWPATPDVMYLPNGDPGYPGDPEELEVTKVYIRTKDDAPKSVILTDCFDADEITAIADQILEEGPDDGD